MVLKWLTHFLNRFTNLHRAKRLLGTQVSLIGATTNTSCVTINSVSSELSLQAQTYTIPCPTTKEPTLAVFLYDDVMEESWDKPRTYMIMNLAEVRIFVDVKPSK